MTYSLPTDKIDGAQGNPIVHALNRASRSTGVDFSYLLSTAERESGQDPSLKAKTSSAAGLFQFIEQTWLQTMKRYGAQHGLGAVAKNIQEKTSGKFSVESSDDLKKILDLRFDPNISSLMAGELSRENNEYLQKQFGRKVSGGELYIAHFLGSEGAVKLIGAHRSDPDRPAHEIFQAEAKANKGVFYQENGEARTVAEVITALKGQISPSRESFPNDAFSQSEIEEFARSILLKPFAHWRAETNLTTSMLSILQDVSSLSILSGNKIDTEED